MTCFEKIKSYEIVLAYVNGSLSHSIVGKKYIELQYDFIIKWKFFFPHILNKN